METSHKYTLEKTEGSIKNGQSREQETLGTQGTGRRQTTQEPQCRNRQKMNNTEPTKNHGTGHRHP